MFRHLRPINIFNAAAAILALAISGYTLVNNQVEVANVREKQQERMLYGSYRLGQDYMMLVSCVRPNRYTVCQHSTDNRDFAKLEPISAVLFGHAIDWPALRGTDSVETIESLNRSILERGNVVFDALEAQYVERSVEDAFQLGESIQLLRILIRNPATAGNETNEHKKYAAIIKGVIEPSLSDLSGCCGRQLPVTLTSYDIDSLDACLRDDFLGASPSPSPNPSPSSSPCP